MKEKRERPKNQTKRPRVAGSNRSALAECAAPIKAMLDAHRAAIAAAAAVQFAQFFMSRPPLSEQEAPPPSSAAEDADAAMLQRGICDVRAVIK